MKIVTKEEWINAAVEIFGENYSTRIGSDESNKFIGRYYLYEVKPNVFGPLCKAIAVNFANDKFGRGYSSDEYTHNELLDAVYDFEVASKNKWGAGLSEKEFKILYIATSIKVGRTPDTDGWHDWMPHNPANSELCDICSKAILEASLVVGGKIIAHDPETYVGLFDEMARLVSDSAPKADYDKFFSNQEKEFILMATTLLGI